MTEPVRAQDPTVDAAPRDRPKRIVVCLDGTWASPARESARDDEDDKVYKPTNVLKACRAVRTVNQVVGTLTLTGQPLDGETVTLGDKTYTFQDELTDEDGHVAIGRTTQSSVENLLYAIDLQRHRDRYSDSMTRHPTLVGQEVPGDGCSLQIVVRTGAVAPPLDLAETLSHGSWGDERALLEETRRRGLDPAEGTPQIAYYDIGVGALRRFPGFWNSIHHRVDKLGGGARGAGFEGNVEDAYLFLCYNYQPGDEIYLFGFSRGAAEARGLAQFIDWMGGILPARDAYWAPRYCDAFLAEDRGETAVGVRRQIFEERLAKTRKKEDTEEEAQAAARRRTGTILPAKIRFLGVWDTVLSLGGERDERFLRPTPPAAVEHARQALALDERRRDFKPRIWEGAAHDGQTLAQRWFAGVHTNIGGGYVDDGLANIALKWMLQEAQAAGLGLDHEHLGFYPAYPFDRLYTSYKGFYKLFRRKRVRDLGVDTRAGMTIDGSVFDRLIGPPEGSDHPDFETYRPKNLLEFLRAVDDLDAFMAQIPDLSDDFTLERLEAVLRDSR